MLSKIMVVFCLTREKYKDYVKYIYFYKKLKNLQENIDMGHTHTQKSF